MAWSRTNESSKATETVVAHVFQSASVPATLSGRGIQAVGEGATGSRCAVCFRMATDPIHRDGQGDSPRWGF